MTSVLDKLHADLNARRPARTKAKTIKVAVMPDGTEYPMRKVNGLVHLDNGTSASTIQSAVDHYKHKGATIERRKN